LGSVFINTFIIGSDKVTFTMYSSSTNESYGCRNIVKRLRRTEFAVKYSLPKYNHKIGAENSDTYVGLIYAKEVV